MSYTLKPESEAASEHAAFARVQKPVSLQRVTTGVVIGATMLFSLAGLPSFGIKKPPLPATDGLAHTRSLLCYSELQRTFADVLGPVDPVTLQRPIYPDSSELTKRLQRIDGWETGVMFISDVTPSELHAAGIEDAGLCVALADQSFVIPHQPVLIWRLVLLDELSRIVGTVAFQVPKLSIERIVIDDADLADSPLLDKRLPDWPRAALFPRRVAEAQSNG